MTLILSNDDVARVLTMPDCLSVLEQAYRDLHAGDAVTRRRSDCLTPTVREDATYGFKTMDGVIPSQGVAAVRLNSDIVTWPTVDGNQRRVKIPAAPNTRWTGLILVFSTSTGEPLATSSLYSDKDSAACPVRRRASAWPRRARAARVSFRIASMARSYPAMASL